MTQILARIGVTAAVIMTMVGAAFAHHGDSGRYEDTLTTVKGKVVELQLVNPHSFLVLEVVDASGKATKWRGELGSAVGMRRWGWTRDTIARGATLTVTGRRLKSGAPFMTLSEGARVVDASGKEIYRGNAPGQPAAVPTSGRR